MIHSLNAHPLVFYVWFIIPMTHWTKAIHSQGIGFAWCAGLNWIGSYVYVDRADCDMQGFFYQIFSAIWTYGYFEFISEGKFVGKHSKLDNFLLTDSILCLFYPRPVLAFGYCRSLRLSVCLSVCPSVCAVITCLSVRSLRTRSSWDHQIWTKDAKDFE